MAWRMGLMILAIAACGCSSTSSDMLGSSGTNTQLADSSAWGFTFDAPSGWKTVDQNPYTYLGSDTDPGIIALGRATFTTDTEALNALGSIAAALKLQGGTAIEAPADTTIAGLRALTATYGAYASDGSQVKARFITLFSDYGTSLSILGLTATAQFDGLKERTDAVAASVKASAPVVNQRVANALVGKWIYVYNSGDSSYDSSASKSVDASITFDGSSFSYSSESSVFVDSSYESDYGTYYGDAASAHQTSDHGTYTIIGPDLVCKGQHGSFVVSFTLDSQGLTIGGRLYLADHG